MANTLKYTHKPRTSSFRTIVLSDDSQLESQCDENFKKMMYNQSIAVIGLHICGRLSYRLSYDRAQLLRILGNSIS